MNKEMTRKTIKNDIVVKGIGLHSGKQVHLRLIPAGENTGIVFIPNNKKKNFSIQSSLENVVDTSNAVTLGDGVNTIQTVEHLMAAIATTGITDLLVEIDSIEIPIMDGSALPFVQAIEQTGTIDLNGIVEPITIQNPLWVVDGDKYLVALPANEFKATYSIHFDHPLLRGQSITLSLSKENILKEVISARTFGFLKDVEALQARGLALGGSPDNAVVLTDTGYVNQDLRFEDECVRHKVLDLIGDLAIMGRPVKGHIIASKAGHTMDISLGKLIMSTVTGNEISKFKSRRFPFFQKRELSRNIN
ncbi:MAG: UDP-3-O-acyl-N-acetylglucosamine deacetylase [Leptospiraceae bacterium]|nr:UDP-3-O-acyl-N-acetylglucosamine deacetylase [Leptospiraceae bacterium]MCP5494287.1 UDP-3-O-acyl-N-acetylglucosamine deacetylase [Leptospiraceae bacterium]